ncbi:hypothetical protein [Kitasatospora sp. NPDC085464]|uniref:hypothetical protein n=1 Tax=Kitasatospora sp. NPDC085464 TaxID=3364063 RepID=UPI0037CAB516
MPLPLLETLPTRDPRMVRDNSPYRRLAQEVLKAHTAKNADQLEALLRAYALMVHPLPSSHTKAVAVVRQELADSDAFWNTPALERYDLIPADARGDGGRYMTLRGTCLLDAQRSEYGPDGKRWNNRTFGERFGMSRGRVDQLLQAAKKAADYDLTKVEEDAES